MNASIRVRVHDRVACYRENIFRTDRYCKEKPLPISIKLILCFYEKNSKEK